MILRRLYNDDLAQATYLLGCAATGEALVVDPNRDLDPVLQAAADEGLRVTAVTETHIHADFLSGARELARRTGATLLLSDEGGPDWAYRFAAEDGATLLRDADEFRVGNIVVRAVHTPGHTPEHLTFAVTDTAGADRPMGAFTGDFLFVGDVGRPDLLEVAAGQAGAMEESARTLFRSIHRFADEFPDYLQIWPGHGAGSACGKSLSAVPQSTLGYEKRFNWAFQPADPESFLAAVLEGQPEPPRYFGRMKILNRDGPEPTADGPLPPTLPDAQLPAVLASGAALLDTRDGSAFARAHLPGTYHSPLRSGSFLTWAASVLPYDRDLYLIAGGDARGAIRALALVGLERVRGIFAPSAVADGRASPVPEVRPGELEKAIRDHGALVLDVRTGAERSDGAIPGSLGLPLPRLVDQIPQLPRDRPLIVHCQTGSRSFVAIAALEAHGFPDVRHLAGDYRAWARASTLTG